MSKKAAKTAEETSKKSVSGEKNTSKKKQQVDDAKQEQKTKEDITSEDNKKKDVKTENKSEKKVKRESPAKKLKEAEEKANEWHNKYLRLSAEFDNYRKRTLKEKADLLRMGNEDLLKDILPVIDDFERGIDNIDTSEDVHALKEGVHLIYNKFTDFIKQKGIKEIEAQGQLFDIDYHEALTKIPAPEEEQKGKVVDVIEKGYILNEKVIRYAKVVVGE